MTYYTTFDSEGFSRGFESIHPEPIEGVDVYEVPDEMVHEIAIVLRGDEIRPATVEELKERYEKFSHQAKARDLRFQRNQILSSTDVLVGADRWEQYSEAEKLSISKYRQALRDLPSQAGFPETVDFPIMESGE